MTPTMFIGRSLLSREFRAAETEIQHFLYMKIAYIAEKRGLQLLFFLY